MYVVEVIPIMRGAFKERLSFFSKNPLPVGAVVDASVRGKAIPALVVSNKDAREERQTLRSHDFALKKLEPRIMRHLFSKETVHAFESIAEYHVTPLGSVLAYFTPTTLLNSTEPTLGVEPDTDTPKTASDILALQAEYEERVRMYRNSAREAFARGGSVVIVVPTIVEGEALYDKLHRGIDEHVLLLTSAHTKKTALNAWQRAQSDPEPLLLIVTPSYLAVPRKHVHTYIIERESARSFRTRERPLLDTRVCAEFIARAHGARLILADFPLRIETRARLETGSIEELMRLQVSAQNQTRARIIDTRQKNDPEAPPQKKKNFTTISEHVETHIRTELENGGRVFVYAARRGLAPLTVCNDCGSVVVDPTNKTPMTLHKTDQGNVFVSFYSGALMKANSSCASCGSWNLTSLGVGVERVFEDIEKRFPEAKPLLLSADTANTHSKAKKMSEQFYASRSAILIGTERALPYLVEPVELSVVASIDSLLSLSAWRAHEYALNALFFLRDRTEQSLLIQTRQPDHEVLKAVVSGNPTEFIRSELADRQTFSYPPFATFVGLAWSGTEQGVHQMGETLRDVLRGWDVVGPLPARHVGKNRYLARAVVRLPRLQHSDKSPWPHRRLLDILNTLPREVAITIDPDEIV